MSLGDFPWPRIEGLLGLDPGTAVSTMHEADDAREAVLAASRSYIEADDDRRAGRTPSSPIAAHPDFPTGLGMSLIGASVLWEATDLVPQLALRVGKDHFEDGDLELAASFAGMVGDMARPGVDDAEAWAAQSLLVAIFSRGGRPEDADALARDLAAHSVPVDLFHDDDPHLPDESMTWHGGAFVEGMPPRRDGRALSVEDAGAYVEDLLRRTLREREVEGESGQGAGGDGEPGGDR